MLCVLFSITHGQNGSTPLNSAAEGGHAETVKLLLLEGAKADVTNGVSNMTSDTTYITIIHMTIAFYSS